MHACVFRGLRNEPYVRRACLVNKSAVSWEKLLYSNCQIFFAESVFLHLPSKFWLVWDVLDSACKKRIYFLLYPANNAYLVCFGFNLCSFATVFCFYLSIFVEIDLDQIVVEFYFIETERNWMNKMQYEW